MTGQGRNSDHKKRKRKRKKQRQQEAISRAKTEDGKLKTTKKYQPENYHFSKAEVLITL